VDLKARVALKTDRSVFKARSKTPKSESRNCFSNSKQEAKRKSRSKVSKTNVSDDYTLTNSLPRDRN